MLARWGISNEVISDNGTQFPSTCFSEIASKYGFTHKTVSLHFPQANGAAESWIKIAKRFLEHAGSNYIP